MKLLKILGIIFASIIGLVIIYLFVIIFTPIVSVLEQPIKININKNYKAPDYRKDVSFVVDGLNVRAWLYIPQQINDSQVPCVIMNSGLGGTKDIILEKYAERFVEAGISTLTYDYRYFGESDGEPRNRFAINYQLEDLKGAIKYVRSVSYINPDKIAIWGTSAAGGYGFIVAAEDKKIACVLGQCPSLDGEADSKVMLEQGGIGYFINLFINAQKDQGRARFGLSPHKIPIVGKPGTMAMLNAPGAYEGYLKIISDSPGAYNFKNEICARAIFESEEINPKDSLKDVDCPSMLLICEKDEILSQSSYEGVIKLLGDKVEVKKYPVGHFDIYLGENFETAITEQIKFFKKYLF